MKIAVLSPVAWRTPPAHYGPWEQVASAITEGLVEKGIEVALFATGDSITRAKLETAVPHGYEEDKNVDAKVAECLHISHLMEKADEFDLIHNHFDFLPLTYSRMISTPMVTTIHGFSSPKIIPVYKKYNDTTYYVSISNADRSPELNYSGTVYNGLNTANFTFINNPTGNYLLFLGRIHQDKGTHEAILIAWKSNCKIIIAGIIQDNQYFSEMVAPYIDNDRVCYEGAVGPERRNELLGNAIALLHPVQFEEPFGLSVAESMLCGTPVIAFNKGAMPELIRDGESGFLVNTTEEAIERVGNLSQINRLICHEWAMSNFSREKMVSDYLKIYHRILERT